MAKLRVGNIEPQSGTNLTLGTSGDSVTVSSTELRVNTFKDVGGNTLWTSDGSGTLSSINSGLAGGGLTLINTYNPSGVSSLDITTGIDSTYDEYIVRFCDVKPDTDNVYLRFQADTGTNTSYNLQHTNTFWKAAHYVSNPNGSASYDPGVDDFQQTTPIKLMQGMSNASDDSTVGFVQIFQPSRTDCRKRFFSETTGIYENPGVVANYIYGQWNTNSAITRLQFSVDSGIWGGTFQLFGVS